MRTEIGGVIGYKVRFEERLSKETRVKFITDGMLLREAIADPGLSHYSVVILDEAHERTINSDVLLALVKRIANERPKKHPLKIVVMSATLEVQKFQGYFKDLQEPSPGQII